MLTSADQSPHIFGQQFHTAYNEALLSTPLFTYNAGLNLIDAARATRSKTNSQQDQTRTVVVVVFLSCVLRRTAHHRPLASTLRKTKRLRRRLL